MNKEKESKFTVHLFFALMFILLSMVLYHTINTFGKDTGDNRTKIGFILDGKADDDGWNEANTDGIYAAREKLDFNLFVADQINGDQKKLYRTVKDMSDKGCHAIILTSGNFESLMEKYAGEFSDITFLCNAPTKGVLNFVNYSSRVYQARYLSGIIAGKMTNSNKIGYVAAFPSAEVNQGINAFTLGVKKTNVDAEVDVMFTGSYSDMEKEVEFADSLVRDYGCDLLTVHANTNTVGNVADKNNVYYIGYHKPSGKPRELVSVETNWDLIYTDLIRDFLRGNITRDSDYWFGMENEYVGLQGYSELLPDYVMNRVDSERRMILKGNDVFSNMIRNTNGDVVCRSGETIPDSELIDDMFWYVRGVNLIDDQDR